jgi:hypothetical protein
VREVGSPGRARTCDILINRSDQEPTEEYQDDLTPRQPEEPE